MSRHSATKTDTALDRMDRLELRLQLEELYAEYAHCLDDGAIEHWPDFFADACSYMLIPRENYDEGLPLATIRCESKGYLKDRVAAVQDTALYAPLTLRHLITGVRVTEIAADHVKAEANFAVLRTQVDEITKVFLAGRYIDTIVFEDGQLRFKEKLAIHDSLLIPNSLVIPV